MLTDSEALLLKWERASLLRLAKSVPMGVIIARYRTRHRCSLLEAKNYVERLIAEHSMIFHDGEEIEYIGSDRIDMSYGKKYKIFCAGEDFIVVRNDYGAWVMLHHTYFGRPPRITDLGAAEYDEIMASLGNDA